MRGKGTGDVLARGGIRAQYLTTEKKISDKTWDDAFKDFDPEKFQKEGMPKPESGPKELSVSRR